MPIARSACWESKPCFQPRPTRREMGNAQGSCAEASVSFPMLIHDLLAVLGRVPATVLT